MSGFPSKAELAAHIDSLFTLTDAPDAPLDLQLVELREGGTSLNQEQYSLLLKGPRDPLLPQRIYSLAHRDLGTFDLFLVPIAQNETGTSYEAAFALLFEPDAAGGD